MKIKQVKPSRLKKELERLEKLIETSESARSECSAYALSLTYGAMPNKESLKRLSVLSQHRAKLESQLNRECVEFVRELISITENPPQKGTNPPA